MSWRARLALPLLLLPVVLLLRWGPGHGNWGEQLTPWPDAAEHVAGAQSLASTGRYFLQLGPWRVQPRYPPGFSLLLAPALRLGLPGDQVWRLAALFEWGVVTLLALAVAGIVRRAVPRSRGIALAAGLGAAATWLLAPIVSTQGGFVVSDQPALLFSLLAAVAFARAESGDSGGGAGWYGMSGLAAGWAGAVRPIEGALLAVALVPVAVASVRRRGARAAALSGAVFLAGAAIPALLTAATLHRSGFPAWRWSTYRYWEQNNFHSFERVFSLRHALEGVVPVVDGDGVYRRLPNLELVGATLSGWPGLLEFEYLGYFWPALALAAAVWVGRRLRRGPPGAGPWISAAALWASAHVVLALVFVWPAARLMLATFFLLTLGYWTALGWAWSAGGAKRAAAGLGAVAALGLGLWLWLERVRDAPDYADLNGETRAAVEAWLARQPEVAREPVPFDTVRAQALGLLGPDRLSRVRVWGPLGQSWHFQVLQWSGFVCFQRGYGWHLDDTIRPFEGPPTRR